jgi:hypothetical protein
VSFECAEASFKRMQHRIRQFGLLARIAGVLDPYALPKDVSLHQRNVPVDLGKMLLFLKAADRL